MAPVVLVHGDAGIGKTSLVARFAETAAAQGATVLWGTSYEGGGPPHGAWTEAIDRHVADVPATEFDEVLAGDASVLSVLAPSIRQLMPDLPPAPELAPGEGQSRLFEAVARFLDRLDDPVIVLDDEQWAEAVALDLLVHVVRLVPRLLVIVVFRGGRLPPEHPLALRLSRVGRIRECGDVLLEGLSPEHAAQLLARAAGEELDPELIDAVYAETGGNPFFLGELGRQLRHGADRAAGRGGWKLPETILGAVALRLAPLSAETRRMLELAAVFTAGFSFDELQALTGLDDVTLLDCLEEAVAADLLRAAGEAQYDFAHALVRHALYEGVTPLRRARTHRALAEALQRLYDDMPGRVAAEVARQYRASSTLPGADRGVTYALAAAQHARSAQAPASVVELLRLALDLVPGGDSPLRLQALHELALAEAEAAMPSEAVASLEEAIALLERSGASSWAIAEMTCDVATAMWTSIGYLWKIAPLVTRAVRLLGDQHDLLWARLKLFDRYAEPIRRGPVRIMRLVARDPEAQRIVREQGSKIEIASTIEVSGPWAPGELDWAIAETARWQDPSAQAIALFWIVGRLTLDAAGEHPQLADHVCSELESLSQELGAIWHRSSAHVCRAALLAAQGSLEAATEQMRRARSLAERLPEPGVHMPLILSCEALLAQHTDPEWWRAQDEIWQPGERGFRGFYSPICASIACYALARGGQAESARELLGHVVDALVAADPWDHLVCVTMTAAGAAIWELRDRDLAERLLPAARALVSAEVPDWYMSSAELTVARLASVLDLLDEAAVAFAAARERLEGRQPVMRALVDQDEGLARRLRRRPGAESLLAAAREQFKHLGMTAWLQGLAQPAAERDSLPGGLTYREAEVLRLLAGGLTNRRIAETLGLSVHTVERHLGNAYVKIGAHNRADAATYAVRHGL